MPLEVGGIFLAVHHDEEGTKIAEIAVSRPEYRASIEAKFADCHGILNDVHESFTNEIGFFVQQGAEWNFLTFVHRERIDSSGGGEGGLFSASRRDETGAAAAKSTPAAAAGSVSGSTAAAMASSGNMAATTPAASPANSFQVDTSAFPTASSNSNAPAAATTTTPVMVKKTTGETSRQRGWFCVSVVFALLDPAAVPRSSSPSSLAIARKGGDAGAPCVVPHHQQYVRSLLEKERELSRWHPVVESLAAKLIRAEAKQRFLTRALQHAEMKKKGQEFQPMPSHGLFSGHRNAFDSSGLASRFAPTRATSSSSDEDDTESSDDDDDDEEDSTTSSGDEERKSSSSSVAAAEKEDQEQQTELAWVLQGYLERICNGGGFLWESIGNFMFVYPGGVSDPRLAASSSSPPASGGASSFAASSLRCSVAPSDVPLLVSAEAATFVSNAAAQAHWQLPSAAGASVIGGLGGNNNNNNNSLNLNHNNNSSGSDPLAGSGNPGASVSAFLGIDSGGIGHSIHQQQQQQQHNHHHHPEPQAGAASTGEVLHQHAATLAASADLLLSLVIQYLAKARANKAFPHVQQMAFELHAQMPLVQEAVSVLAAAGVVRVCPGLPLGVHNWAFSGWADSIKLCLTQKFYLDARWGGGSGSSSSNSSESQKNFRHYPLHCQQHAFARECLAEFCREKGKLSTALSKHAATLILGPLLGSIGGALTLNNNHSNNLNAAHGGDSADPASSSSLQQENNMDENNTGALSARTNQSTDSGASSSGCTTASSAVMAAADDGSAHLSAWHLQGCSSNSMRGLAVWVRNFAESVGCPLPLDGSPESALFYGHAAATDAQHHHHHHSSPQQQQQQQQEQAHHSTSTREELAAKPLVVFLASQLGLILRYAFAQQWIKTLEDSRE